MISPATLDDIPGVAALLAAVFDDSVITVAGMRYRQESSPPEDRVGYWRAERSGEIVGWAVGGLDAFASVRTAAFAGIAVHPDHRGEGIGSALWDGLSAHLDEIGARRIVVHSRADADTKAFVANRGFSLEATVTSSAVDPRTVPPPPPPPPGIDVLPLSAFADDPEPVFAADYEGFLDEPGPSDTSGLTYESWLRLFWDNPDCDNELSTAVLAAGVPVGVSYLNSDRATGRGQRGHGGHARVPRSGPRAAAEAALPRVGRRGRDHERDHAERRHERADAGDQRAPRLRAVLRRARLGARALSRSGRLIHRLSPEEAAA